MLGRYILHRPIHAMRESLAKVVEVLREADNLAASASGSLPGEAQQLVVVDRQALRRSGWLRHMSNILEGTALIVRNIHINSSHVLSIAQMVGTERLSICFGPVMPGSLLPHHPRLPNTHRERLVSFGHKFLDRCGHLSSDKFFTSLPDTGGRVAALMLHRRFWFLSRIDSSPKAT